MERNSKRGFTSTRSTRITFHYSKTQPSLIPRSLSLKVRVQLVQGALLRGVWHRHKLVIDPTRGGVMLRASSSQGVRRAEVTSRAKRRRKGSALPPRIF